MNCDHCMDTGWIYEVWAGGEVTREGCQYCEETEDGARARMTAEEAAADLLFGEKN